MLHKSYIIYYFCYIAKTGFTLLLSKIPIQMTKTILFLLIFLFLGMLDSLKAQLSYTGFEGIADETVFTRNTGTSSWVGQGFTVPWVNGFDVNRGYIDNAFAKNGTNSLRIFYPTGQYGPPNSGAQAPLMVTPAPQYYMSYWVRFSSDFSWGNTSQGGKLPGLGGGGRCSGCAVCTGSNGFTARLMWRPGGRLVLYLYHLDKVNPPCGDDLTLQLSAGVDYYAPRGQWIQITQRVKVNTGTNHDGEVQVWVNEQPALLVTGLQFVSNGDQVDNLYFSTFHGGSTAAWSPTVDSYTWFDDIKISTNPADVFSSLAVEALNESGTGQQNLLTKDQKTYPQPIRVGEEFKIKGTSAAMGACDMEWIDVSGKIIYQGKVSDLSGHLTAPTLPKGIYLLKMIFSSEVKMEKVMVE
jgi:hypothetical protein